MYKIMISAGEASGDLHGASVAAALFAARPQIRLIGMGGPAMRSAGVEIVHDIADLAVMGFWEIAKNLPRFFRLRDELTAVMERERPDALVIIDYPDFNLRLAARAKKMGVPVVSYISPSAWAWRKGRAKTVGRLVDRIAAIFPFEADVYRAAGANVSFVGHPLIDIVKPSLSPAAARAKFGAPAGRPLVLLLPGSRRQEIAYLLAPMLKAAAILQAKLPDCQFFLPAAPTIPRGLLEEERRKHGALVTLTDGCAYDLMQIADVAVAASGTVTLEAAIMGLPSVVVYKMSPITYFIASFLVKLPHISLPNIVAGRRVVPELLQAEATADNIAAEAGRILLDAAARRRIVDGLDEARRKLGGPGAVERTAGVILDVAAAKKDGGNA